MLEHDWNYFKELVQALAARASDVAGLDNVKIRTKLLKLFNEAASQPLTFDHLTSLIESEASAKEQNSRKISWILQHALHAKVWCVNPKLISSRAGRIYSPIVEQLRQLGLRPVAARLHDFQTQIQQQKTRVHSTLDAVLFSTDQRTLYLVKGCSIGSVAGNKRLKQVIGIGGGSLWDPTDRIIRDPIVDADACRTLVLAWGILKDTFNDLEVVPVYCIVDDFEAGWHFQSHDLSNSFFAQFDHKRVSLSPFPVLTSSLQFLPQMKEDPDYFNPLPSWVAESPFYAIPPDRPARCLMILDVLQSKQAGNSKEVAAVREIEVAEEVRNRFDFFHTKDMRRHDLLHLERQNLIEKHPGNCFTITALGLARFYVAVAMANGDPTSNFAHTALARIDQQSALIWKQRNL